MSIYLLGACEMDYKVLEQTTNALAATSPTQVCIQLPSNRNNWPTQEKHALMLDERIDCFLDAYELNLNDEQKSSILDYCNGLLVPRGLREKAAIAYCESSNIPFHPVDVPHSYDWRKVTEDSLEGLFTLLPLLITYGNKTGEVDPEDFMKKITDEESFCYSKGNYHIEPKLFHEKMARSSWGANTICDVGKKTMFEANDERLGIDRFGIMASRIAELYDGHNLACICSLETIYAMQQELGPEISEISYVNSH